jgi:outer membrane protein OmpA-like peptidoglycan-associated protein
MRRADRAVRKLATFLVATSAASAASAQDTLDAERFKPAVTHDAFVTVEGSGVRPTQDRFAFGGFLNYAVNPLVGVTGSDVNTQIVGGRLGIDLLGSLTVAGPFAVGLGVPVFLFQSGDLDPSFAGIGDIRLVPKLRILDDRESIGLGIVAELRAPTHAGDFAGGARNVVFWPRVVVDHRFGGSGFRAGSNVGVAVREGTTFLNVNAASEFTYAVALGYRFGGWTGPVELGGEAQGGVGLAEADEEEIPLETLLYVKVIPNDEWEISAGPAFGVIPGWGVPTFRVFAGVRWTPTDHDKDHDGVPDDEDKCPDTPEDRDGDEDLDGCPEEEKDDDVDGIPNSEDDCPTQKETINGIQDEDGCPDGGPARVIREEGRIVILENVEFESGSAQIDQKSHSILNQVALVLKANPDIERLRVEGHTDDTGPREVNMRLSKARAESVRRYLIHRGVRGDRLTAEGYGPDKPLKEGKDVEARAKNRRVEFVVEQ